MRVLRWALMVTLAMGLGQAVRGQEIEVRKPARQANPTMRVVAFKGSERTRREFLEAMKYADWVDVVEQEQTDYRLAASQSRVGGYDRLSVEVRDGAGNKLLSFHQDAPAGQARPLAQAVGDTLIRGLFKSPGLCRSRLAFVRQEGRRKEIWLADFDGSGARRLTHNERLSVEPDWGHGHRYLLYTLYNRFSTDVVLLDTREQRQKRISAFRGLNASAALSPDGKSAALCLSKDGVVDLYRLNLDTWELDRLTESRGVEASPCWSPDGKRLCYVSDSASSRPTLYLQPASGGQAERLLKLPEEAVSPDWCPVTGQIAFALRQGQQYAIAVVDLQGDDRTPRVVTKAAGNWESPSWYPDGRHLVCSREHQGQQGLYLVDTWYGRLLPLKQDRDASLPSASGLPAAP